MPIWISTGLILLLSFISSMAWAAHILGPNRSVIGIVEKMSGASWVERSGNRGKAGVTLGMHLFEGDRLITRHSRLHVRYKDGTYVEMGKQTSFEVERLRFVPPNPLPTDKAANRFDQTVFRFLYGVIRVTAPDVHRLEHFSIDTANAVVQASGPVDFYLVQKVNHSSMNVEVARGKVAAVNVVTDQSMEVPEGTGAFIKVSGLVIGAGPFSSKLESFLKVRTRL